MMLHSVTCVTVTVKCNVNERIEPKKLPSPCTHGNAVTGGVQSTVVSVKTVNYMFGQINYLEVSSIESKCLSRDNKPEIYMLQTTILA